METNQNMIELENGNTQSVDLFKKTTETTLKTVDTEFETNINPEDFPEDFLKLQVDTNVMMQIVTGAMYENPLIPFQELTCNGRDAIIRKINTGYLGFSPKIHVHVDYDKLEVSITDNGIGMSWQKVEDIYCYIGRSDKRDNKSEMGKWGVGAKTPFAMASTYRVKSTSLDNHKTIEFLVTSKGIMKQSEYDQLPNEETGTTITFPISIDYRHDPNKIRHYLRERVDTWNLLVEYSVTHEHGTQEQLQILSRKHLRNPYIPIPLTTKHVLDTSNCSYPLPLIKTNKGFSFALETNRNYMMSNQSPQPVYIEGIEYPLKYSAPSQVFVVLDDLSLLNTSATREKLSYDSKHTDFLELLTSEITSYFKKRFKTLFANPTLNVPEITETDTIWYTHLLSEQKIHPGDYPYYDLLIPKVQVYSRNTCAYSSSKRLNQLKDFTKVYYINSINLPRREAYFELHPNHALIHLPNLCLKDCTKCNNFNLTTPSRYDPLYPHRNSYQYSHSLQPNFRCAKRKDKTSPLLKYYKHLPKFRLPKNTIKAESFRATNVYHSTTKNISYLDKMYYLITKHESDAPFATILQVTEKKFDELKELGWVCFENEESVLNHYRASLKFETEQKTYTLEEVSHYDHIVELRSYDQKVGPEKLHQLIKQHLNLNVLFVFDVKHKALLNYATNLKIQSWTDFIRAIPKNLNFRITYEEQTTFFDYISTSTPPTLNVKFHKRVRPQLKSSIFNNF